MSEETNSGEGGPDTKDAEALAEALNHSAERVQTLWFSFITFMLYLAIATGTTTHRMLFLESPLNLPVLNVSLPLLFFYTLTPIIFVVFHLYTLLNLVLLARSAKAFDDVLWLAFPRNGTAREYFRMRIENTLFVQLLVGAELEREGFNGKLLSLIALTTLTAAPVALLLMIQIKFLPYHSLQITNLHRVLLVGDLIAVWILWPMYRRGWGNPDLPYPARRGHWQLLAVFAYAWLVATFPSEPAYLLGKLLPGHWYDLITPSNILLLSREDLIDDTILARIIEKNEGSVIRYVGSLTLKDRDLTGAQLNYADIRHVDFSNAILNGAELVGAWVQSSDFSGAHLEGAILERAQLQGANLFNAELQDSALREAQLQGAHLRFARLQGASLAEANLQGAEFYKANLEGVSLYNAQLQGASFERVQLQGASLDGANLAGASFKEVFVWRADARKAVWKDTRVASIETNAKEPCESYTGPRVCDWTTGSFSKVEKLVAWADLGVMNPSRSFHDHDPMEFVAPLDPRKALDGEQEIAQLWADHERSTPALSAYEKIRAEHLRNIGCATVGAPYVVRALLNYMDRLSGLQIGSEEPKLAAAFLDKNCAGARGLSEAEIAKLKAIGDSSLQQAPKP